MNSMATTTSLIIPTTQKSKRIRLKVKTIDDDVDVDNDDDQIKSINCN